MVMQTLLLQRAGALRPLSFTRSPHHFRSLQTCLLSSNSYTATTTNDLLGFRTYSNPQGPSARPRRNSRTPLLTRRTPPKSEDEQNPQQHYPHNAEPSEGQKCKDQAKGHPDPETATTKESAPLPQTRKTKKNCPEGVHYVKPSYRHLSYRRIRSTADHKASTEVGSTTARSCESTVNVKAGRKVQGKREAEFCLTGSVVMYEKDDLGNGKWNGR
jgi:hypothetical protein